MSVGHLVENPNLVECVVCPVPTYATHLVDVGPTGPSGMWPVCCHHADCAGDPDVCMETPVREACGEPGCEWHPDPGCNQVQPPVDMPRTTLDNEHGRRHQAIDAMGG